MHSLSEQHFGKGFYDSVDVKQCESKQARGESTKRNSEIKVNIGNLKAAMFRNLWYFDNLVPRAILLAPDTKESFIVHRTLFNCSQTSEKWFVRLNNS